MKSNRTSILYITLSLLGCAYSSAQTGSDKTKVVPDPLQKTETKTSEAALLEQLKKVDETTYQIGRITIDTLKRSISFDATFEITDTLIEYAIVNPEGKIHEALFITDVRPIHLNIAFKLLGFKENKSLFRKFVNDLPTAEYNTATPEQKAHSYFNISVSWTDAKSKNMHSHNINELIRNAQNESTLAQAKTNEIWSYGGSFMHKGKFAAELNKDLIAIFTDRGAVANYAGKGREDDTLWHPVTEKLPLYGTKATITITPQFPSLKK